MADELAQQASTRTVSLISAVVRSINAVSEEIALEREQIEKETPEIKEFDDLLQSLESVEMYKAPEPSIYDVFELPPEDAAMEESLPSFEGFPTLDDMPPLEEIAPVEEGQVPPDGAGELDGMPPVEQAPAPQETPSEDIFDGFPTLE